MNRYKVLLVNPPHVDDMRFNLDKNMSVKKSGVIFPYMLEWRLTDACNMRCKYCTEYKPEYENIDYSEILDRILKLRPRFIWFGGLCKTAQTSGKDRNILCH